MGLRDFAWDNGFPGLGIIATLMCLELMGIYPKVKLALSSNQKFAREQIEALLYHDGHYTISAWRFIG